MAESAPEAAPETPAEPPAPETYTAEQYEAVKDEAAKRRIANRELGEKNVAMSQRLLEQTIAMTCKDLADPSDLLAYTQSADLLGEDGYPDEHMVLQAEADLLKLKPHLRSRRPVKTFEQGPRGGETETFSFNEWLKGAAG